MIVHVVVFILDFEFKQHGEVVTVRASPCGQTLLGREPTRSHLMADKMPDIHAVFNEAIDQPITEKPGTVIDRYKLLEQIAN